MNNLPTTFLQNVDLKPGHVDAAVAALTSLQLREGVDLLDAYLETGAGFTYRLASGEQGDTGSRQTLTSLWSAPEGFLGIPGQLDPYADAVTWRRVEVEMLVQPVAETPEKMVVLRRYLIQGDWDEFLAVWRKVATMRERHGFHVTFAVSDRETRTFTWAFTTELDDFSVFMSEGQKDYYADPGRVELETINAFLEQITLSPSRRIA